VARLAPAPVVAGTAVVVAAPVSALASVRPTVGVAAVLATLASRAPVPTGAPVAA